MFTDSISPHRRAKQRLLNLLAWAILRSKAPAPELKA